MKWIAIIPGCVEHLDAYGENEKEARRYLRKALRVSRLPAGTKVRQPKTTTHDKVAYGSK